MIDKATSKQKKAPGYALIGIFFLLWIGGFFAMHLLLPDKSFSDMENRVLKQLPPFSANALFRGSFTSDFEIYVSDQFPLRDQLVRLNTAAEYLSGREERNGVYYVKNGLIQAFPELNDYRLTTNANAVVTLKKQLHIPVYTALLPSAADIWQEQLAPGAPNVDQSAAIRQAYTVIVTNCADVYGSLAKHKNEPIYYRTDHHWTTLGAYYGYAATMEAMGISPVPLAVYTKSTVSTDFFGTLYSSAPLWQIQPDSIVTYVPENSVAVTVFDGVNTIEKELYCEDQLQNKNKYAMFLGGNQPQIVIRTPNATAPKLLVLRDSYMDSEAPYLIKHFSEIHLLDLRYYKSSIPAYVQKNDIDMVLISYSLRNFNEDSNLAFVTELS